MASATLSILHRADGSAAYTDNGFSVIAAVNGPIEVQRRDELPEEAAIDVAVLPILSGLLQASMMALLATSIPLAMTLSATFLVVDMDQQIIVKPSAQDIIMAMSIHVFAFLSSGELLVDESEGDFEIDIWEEVYKKAKLLCLGNEDEDSESEDMSMESNNAARLQDVMYDEVRRKVESENKWKDNSG
ncbi:hypothetical protein P7C71_g5117, partial [Lecanoromycetidae sp. Uapishka_2]